ncbi:hypothetical protein D3C75_1103430 [compost metagenome]
MVAKKSSANSRKAAAGATFFIPFNIISGTCSPKPPSRAKKTGTSVSAVIVDIRFVMMRNVNVAIINKPSTMSISVNLGILFL